MGSFCPPCVCSRILPCYLPGFWPLTILGSFRLICSGSLTASGRRACCGIFVTSATSGHRFFPVASATSGHRICSVASDASGHCILSCIPAAPGHLTDSGTLTASGCHPAAIRFLISPGSLTSL